MLRPDTQALWDILKANKALGGFVLIGGTALTMHLGHRLSEDLDFAYPGKRLPRSRIDAIKRMLQEHGWNLIANDSQQAVMEFEDTGMDLLDYQQDFIATNQASSGSVKVTFLSPDPEALAQMKAAAADFPRVASIDEIFHLKCIACANRSKSRDWLDLYILLSRNYIQPIDMRAPFEAAGVPQKYDIAMRRLCSGRLDPSDEGFDSLLPSPPSIADMQAYFLSVRDEIEVELAARASLRSQNPR